MREGEGGRGGGESHGKGAWHEGGVVRSRGQGVECGEQSLESAICAATYLVVMVGRVGRGGDVKLPKDAEPRPGQPQATGTSRPLCWCDTGVVKVVSGVRVITLCMVDVYPLAVHLRLLAGAAARQRCPSLTPLQHLCISTSRCFCPTTAGKTYA